MKRYLTISVLLLIVLFIVLAYTSPSYLKIDVLTRPFSFLDPFLTVIQILVLLAIWGYASNGDDGNFKKNTQVDPLMH